MRPAAEWLLREDAAPSDAERAAFAEIAPPPALAEATLRAMQAEIGALPEAIAPLPQLPAPANRNRWLWLGVGVAAAIALFTLGGPHRQGDLSQMTIRGTESGGPEVSLKMAARHGGKLERLRQGERYTPGDALFFRAQTAGEGWVHLVHARSDGVEVLDQRALAAGEADLARDGEALAWTLDAADNGSAFVLLSSKEPREAVALEAMLEGRLPPEARTDPAALCAAARTEGLGCDGARVEVSP